VITAASTAQAAARGSLALPERGQHCGTIYAFRKFTTARTCEFT